MYTYIYICIIIYIRERERERERARLGCNLFKSALVGLKSALCLCSCGCGKIFVFFGMGVRLCVAAFAADSTNYCLRKVELVVVAAEYISAEALRKFLCSIASFHYHCLNSIEIVIHKFSVRHLEILPLGSSHSSHLLPI